MASNTRSPDPRLLSLPATELDDAIELLDGVHATMQALEELLHAHLNDGVPLEPIAMGWTRVCRAACRVVIATLSDAEGPPNSSPTND